MHPTPHNFYYDPLRQGDGRNVWSWYQGDPYQTGGYLVLLNATGIMYYDCGKGCLSFTLNVPTDASGGMVRQWGLKSGDDYVLFDVSGGTFQAKTAALRATSTGSSTITWDSAWTSVDTTFMIRWEAGIATFYVNNIQRAQISDASIPYGPLSPFVTSNGADLFLIKSVVGQGHQTLILNPVITTSDGGLGMGSVSDSLSITESVTRATTGGVPEVTEALTISESITMTGTADPALVTDALTAAENVNADHTVSVSDVTDSLTNTESTNADHTMDATISDALTVSDVVTDSVA